MVKCEICGKEFSEKGIGSHVWRMHGEGIGFDPCKCFKDGSKVVWNKGKTSQTCQAIREASESRRRIKSELELELDDDNKLIDKWRNKCVNARYAGVECYLTFEEYCMLVKQAGLKSSQLGYSGENYVLARYNDQGDYTFDNCRFITQQENTKERKISDKAIQARSAAGEKLRLRHKSDSDWHNKCLAAVKEGVRNSQYFKDRSEQAAIREQERRSKLNPNCVGVKNSQHGSFWITNDINNSKWNESLGDLPEGYRRGRIMGLPSISKDTIKF